MPNKVSSIKMWENNVDTPISASNLSKSINFQASGKFISVTNALDQKEKWADYVVEEFVSPPPDTYLGVLVYNRNTNIAKTVRFNSTLQQNEWFPAHESSNYDMENKVLRVESGVQISMSYVHSETNERMYLNFDLGHTPQYFSFDDKVNESGAVTDFEANKTYYIYLMHNFTAGDSAHIKIIKAEDLSKDFWKTIAENPLSPTGYEVIAYRQIGGFQTGLDKKIIPTSTWDLFTYRDEISTEKINIIESGHVREMDATDIKIKNEQGLFNANNIESAAGETRILLDNIRSQFYTNRRIGVNLRFTPFKKTSTGGYAQTLINELTLFISAGVIDVFGTQKTFSDDLFLNKEGLQMRVNDSGPVSGVYLGTGSNRLDEGVWRVFLDPTTLTEQGNIIFKKESFERPVYDPITYGWFDLQGNRCIGKFRVKKDNGYYIEKMSVTDTFDQNTPPNTIHIHHGTLVPDGLLLCDGKWHDIKGIDTNSYTWQELVDQVGYDWGESWYEETPDMFDRFIKMPPVENINMNSAKNFIIPTGDGSVSGSSADTGRSAGSKSHSHLHPHSHGKGTLNIIPGFGSHPHNEITYSGTLSEVVNVETVAVGTSVAKEEHQHNLIISGGTHSHPNNSFQGETERIEDEESRTEFESSEPPYKEFLICIKK